MTLDTIARRAGLGFLAVREEQFDFMVPKKRLDRPAVKAFSTLLEEPATRETLTRLGMRL
jgi:putative molybdopterin biosynthesis protein